MIKFQAIKVPTDWKLKKLDETVGEKKSLIVGGPFGSNLKVTDYEEEGIPILRLQNIDFFEFIPRDIKFISEQKAEELSYHSFKGGDIALAKLGIPVGKTCIIPKYLKYGIVTADVIRIRNENPEVLDRFLMNMLNSFFVNKQLMHKVIGSTRPRTNLKDIRGLFVLIPPIEEQKGIVSVLENVDNIIQSTRRLIDTLGVMKRGVMRRLFTEGIGHTEYKDSTQGTIPEDWEQVKLSLVVNINPKYNSPKQYDYLFLPMDAVSEENWKPKYWERRSKSLTNVKFKKNDVLFARITPSTEHGKGALIKDIDELIAYGSTELVVLSPKQEKIIPEFLFYVTKLPSIRKRAARLMEGATGRQRVPKFFFDTQKILLPSIREQRKIVSILANVDDCIEKEERYRSMLKSVKRGLMQVLLTGERRVPVN